MRYLAGIAALGLLLAVTGTAGANTIQSSTLEFSGTLTDNSDGTYSGNLLSTKGFDLYAKVGSLVTSSASSIDGGLVGSDHDAYPLWSPDVPDADPSWSAGVYYALHLDGSNGLWDVRYLNTPGNPNSGAAYTPLSGTLDWTTGIASESGANWEETWSSHGYENIHLQYGTYDFALNVLSGGGTGQDADVEVTMTPVPEPLTMAGLMLGVGSLVGYVRRRRK